MFLNFRILFCVIIFSCISSIESNANVKNSKMNIAIIGGGAAGLASARYCTDSSFNFSCEIFEQMDEIGGTWVYTNNTSVDEYGIPIHTSMYKDLITNLPKEVMEFPDFPFPNYDRSFINQAQVLKYLHDYADHFNLYQYIKFRHQVKLVQPIENNRWSVTVTDLKQNKNITKEYDAVLVCNGHYSKPIIPKLKGQDLFEGIKMHSHDYRTSEIFKNKTVLVIGAGPSGIDIVERLSEFASKVILSHRRQVIRWPFPSNVILKPETVTFSKTAVHFKDNSSENIDALIYCTGYEVNFPFLTKECGVNVKNNHVFPLYKHVVNIEKPTMGFIGLMFAVIPFPVFDYQVRLFLRHLHDDIKLPSKEEMLLDTEREMTLRQTKGYPEHYSHKLGFDFQESYFNELADVGNVTRFPPVKLKIYVDTSMKPNKNFVYKIIDNENFSKSVYEPKSKN